MGCYSPASKGSRLDSPLVVIWLAVEVDIPLVRGIRRKFHAAMGVQVPSKTGILTMSLEKV